MKKVPKVLLIILIIIAIPVLILIIGLLFLHLYPSIGAHPSSAEKDAYEERTSAFRDGTFHNENESALMSGESYASDPRRIPEQILPADKPALLT